MRKPETTYLGDTYRFNWGDDGVEIILDRISEDGKQGPKGELSIKMARPGMEGHLHGPVRFNLTASTTRAQLVRQLLERVGDVDWYGALEQVCVLSIQRWRDGDPVIDLASVPPRESARFLVEPFIEDSGTTIIFADGGTGKSTLALALGATVALGKPILEITPRATCPVLYLDWESDESTHAERLSALVGVVPAGLMHYRRQVASLTESAPTLRRRIAELGIGLVIVDSLGAARGGEPESAEVTIKTFNAIRSLSIPALAIDHVAKHSTENRPNKPFGSAFSYNLARLVWAAEKVQEEGDEKSTIALTNTKSNNGRLHKRRGYRVEFANDDDGRVMAITYTLCDIRDMPEFRGKLTQQDQLAAVLRQNNGGPLTPQEIADCLQADGITWAESTIRTVLGRYRDMFVQLADSDGRSRLWGLRARPL